MSNFFSSVFNFFYTLFNQIGAAFSGFSVFDAIDILIITFIIYKAIGLFRETRAQSLIKGIIVLFLAWVLATWFDLVSLKWVLNKVVDYAIIAVVVVFQPELRRALERMGRRNIFNLGIGQSTYTDREKVLKVIDFVCRSAITMSEKKCGALIVFEKENSLTEVIATGTSVDAKVSTDLIFNIFYPKSPLHDGAMIIRDNRIISAGCILPLTSNTNISHELGTRHRAAIGMSEISDAVIIVVSEETGIISVASKGSLTRNFDGISLRKVLISSLITEGQNKAKKNIFSKILKRNNNTDKDGGYYEE
ncbi:MAG: diadenylate cyclase CdaA [bacterium]|nr:diadenylate cyclase CdaA [bacterium]